MNGIDPESDEYVSGFWNGAFWGCVVGGCVATVVWFVLT